MKGRRGLDVASAALGLALLVLSVYAPVSHHAFVDFDDGEYVYQNPQVLAGLTWSGVVWAFTTGHAANWHPLTWLSHMADVSLFGPAPGAHHVVNAALHAVSAILLFLALRALTGAAWRSAVVAALFAVHPLNVQSVAWVAERKNVLSTLFWLLALLAYAAYARQPSRKRLGVVAILLALGLMSKPMLVTLPLVLLILDFWPLERLRSQDGKPGRVGWQALKPLLSEKAPLVALALVSSAVTWLVQARGLATASVVHFPVVDRLANAASSYGRYLVDALWPTCLSFFYPHPRVVGEPVNLGAGLLWGLVLAGISATAWRSRSRFPYLAAGWAWYVVTLVPVIGIVQVGAQARADRYAYVPMIGIFIVVVWGISELAADVPARRLLAGVAAAGAIGFLAVRARVEVGYWRDGGTLYGRALELDSKNWLAWNNLGTYRLDRGDAAAALPCFDSAARIHRDFADVHYNRGVALQRLGRPFEAIAAYRRTLEIDPGNADGWVNLGNALAGVGRPLDAVPCFARALKIRPDDPYALYGLVLTYDTLGDRRRALEALGHLRLVNPQMARELAPGAVP